MPLFGSSKKSPQEIVKILCEALVILSSESKGKKAEKALEDATKQIQACKNILVGSGETDVQSDAVVQLANEYYGGSVFVNLVTNISKFDFEARKEIAQILSILLRRQVGARFPTVEKLVTTDIVFTLLEGYENPDIALNCGSMLRDCIRYEPLGKKLLNARQFYKLFQYVELSTFDLASDAFSTFKDLLTRHKVLCAHFLEKDYDEIFTKYRVLLDSENYVTKRQSLKLLGELLLDRHNFVVMTRYISNSDNLKLMMNLLRDKSRNIQFEAFHVFKVFVANPNKTQPIMDILLKNKDKLVDFLTNFHSDRTEDEQFNDEKMYLIKQIRELQPITTAPAAAAAQAMDQSSGVKS